MNESIQKLIKPVLVRWLCKCKWIRHNSDDMNKLWLESDERTGVIEFYDADEYAPEDILELTGYDKKTGKRIYYLHFELHDLSFVLDRLGNFFAFIYGGEQVAVDSGRKEQGKAPVRNVAFCCTSGWTSTHFAEKIQEIFDEKNINIRVHAGDYTEMETIVQENDRVLLAPQIGYMLPDLKRLYGDKIEVVETGDFATQNYGHIVEKLIA
ncbi:MAG: hypothetical protein LUC90_09995 [Lachnospiraceae bacterium]|nr:hypothetical protein [Lachnospiraceae bacterium]